MKHAGCNGSHRSMAKRSYPPLEVRDGSQEEVPNVQGQEQWPKVLGCDGTGVAERSYRMPEVRGCGLEEQPHVQGVVAAREQEGQEELLHIQGKERRR